MGEILKPLRACGAVLALLSIVVIYQGCGNSFSAKELSLSTFPDEITLSHSGTKLYATHCASCHSSLSSSTKMGRNFQQIKEAIQTIPKMTHLSLLSDEELTAIENVLKLDSNQNDGIAHVSGKYLPIAQSYKCDSQEVGLSNNGTRRLTRQQMINSLNDLFGSTGAMDQEPVAAAIELLPLDGDIGLVDGFDNSISYVEGLYRVSDAATKFVFTNNNRLNRILPGCTDDVLSANCQNSFSRLARRTLRRPLSNELKQDYTEFIGSLSTPKEALRLAVIRLIMSPEFHNLFEYRGEEAPDGRARLDAFEVASRLSFGLTNHPPDEALLDAAAQGQLSTLEQIKAHGERIVESQKAKDYFVESLISIMRLETSVDPVPLMEAVLGIQPRGLASEMTTEFKNFVEFVVFEKEGTFFDLMNAQVAFPHTDRLASYLGVSTSQTAVIGPAHRAGLIMRPLATKTGQIKSAPIPRGVLMRQQLLCANLPSPDASIIGTRLQEVEKLSEEQYSNREIVAHVTSPQACMSCHSQINSLGFVMESFGPFGEFRNVETVYNHSGEVIATHNIDSQVSDVLVPGQAPSSVSSVKDLATVLGDSPASMRCFSQQMFRFTRLRNAQSNDGCSLNQAADTLIDGGSVKSALVNGIVNEGIFWRSSN